MVYYQIDLQLTDLQTNEVIWIGDKKNLKTKIIISYVFE
ncbi:hypothetical protein [Bacteroidetes bacterium endosymbiont of Geopemphigus sp.]|nr:hypothetical protein [Bacteroidetes bacterium endosymbiont of Geopemphigus sp.]